MDKAFLICPTRGIDLEKYSNLVYWLEKSCEIHWPARDTNQMDDTGFNICLDNYEAIKSSDFVLIVWDGKSQGCLFDLGMAFALGKKLYIVSIPGHSEEKSFQNMIEVWDYLSRLKVLKEQI